MWEPQYDHWSPTWLAVRSDADRDATVKAGELIRAWHRWGGREWREEKELIGFWYWSASKDGSSQWDRIYDLGRNSSNWYGWVKDEDKKWEGLSSSAHKTLPVALDGDSLLVDAETLYKFSTQFLYVQWVVMDDGWWMVWIGNEVGIKSATTRNPMFYQGFIISKSPTYPWISQFLHLHYKTPRKSIFIHNQNITTLPLLCFIPSIWCNQEYLQGQFLHALLESWLPHDHRVLHLFIQVQELQV